MAEIVDYLGRPINKSLLRRDDEDDVRVTSVSQRRYAANVALRLSAERLGDVLTRAGQGDADDFLQLAKDIEKRWLHYRAVINQRKDSVVSITPRVSAASDSPKDVLISEQLAAETKRYDWPTRMRDLLDALAKGYAVVEMTWDFNVQTASPKMKWRDQRDFVYDPETLTRLQRRIPGRHKGEEMTPGKYIVHEPRLVSGIPLDSGLIHPVAIYYLIHSFAMKDWTAFAEVFGFPIRVGTYPEGSTDDQRNDLLAAVRAVGTDAAAIVHERMQIHFEGVVNAPGGGQLFEGLASYCNTECSKAVVGQTLTSEHGAVGSLALGQVMERVKGLTTKADSRALQATVNNQFARVWVDLNYGPQPAYPMIEMEEEEQDDLAALGKFIFDAVDRGVEIEQSWVRDKIGAPEPAAGAKILTAKSSGPGVAAEQEPVTPK